MHGLRRTEDNRPSACSAHGVSAAVFYSKVRCRCDFRSANALRVFSSGQATTENSSMARPRHLSNHELPTYDSILTDFNRKTEVLADGFAYGVLHTAQAEILVFRNKKQIY
ncbi:hypothetical protein EYR41_009523 [Orbilia oligospora]|uniref:Uncharacterized protein n=1 Tax=Orbilia oligospora TaxID=2813651 RepID=A0A7C8KCD0_ORBOL|nr:hypothetical protein TWF751_006374 [Orbilia oligospora]TGJ65565.1 hypothetical protein EYR41_009523 [Orbilia oligospora]